MLILLRDSEQTKATFIPEDFPRLLIEKQYLIFTGVCIFFLYLNCYITWWGVLFFWGVLKERGMWGDRDGGSWEESMILQDSLIVTRAKM